MPRAIKVTDKNLEFIIEYGRTLQFRLDDIKWDLEDADERSLSLYQITDGTPENDNVTFTNMIEPDFRRLWKFKTEEQPFSFVEIERI